MELLSVVDTLDISWGARGMLSSFRKETTQLGGYGQEKMEKKSDEIEGFGSD